MGRVLVECILEAGDVVRTSRLSAPGGPLLVVSCALRQRPRGWVETLTSAEQDVAHRILKGESNSTIARARGVRQRTVANQVAAVFRKLGVNSRAGLAALTSATAREATC